MVDLLVRLLGSVIGPNRLRFLIYYLFVKNVQLNPVKVTTD